MRDLTLPPTPERRHRVLRRAAILHAIAACMIAGLAVAGIVSTTVSPWFLAFAALLLLIELLSVGWAMRELRVARAAKRDGRI